MARSTKTQITTVKLEKTTKNRLDHLKDHEKETYNEIINKALNILNICLTKPLLANKLLREMGRNKNREKFIQNPEKILKRNIRPNNSQLKQQPINPALQSNPRPIPKQNNPNQINLNRQTNSFRPRIVDLRR